MSRQWPALQHPEPPVGCAELYHALRELRTAASLLVVGAHAERDRELGVVMLREISRAERAAKRLVADRGLLPRRVGELM